MSKNGRKSKLSRAILLLALGISGVIPFSAEAKTLTTNIKVDTPSKVKNKIAVLQQTVKGTVTDGQQVPIPGVSIREKNKSANGTTTDGSGNFSLNAPVGATLVFTYIGYETKEVIVEEGNTPLIVRLNASANELEEVTVSIGYQRVRKSDVTGAISSVKSDELNLTAPKLGQALVGKLAGVQVSQTSGAPYNSTRIRVRGIGSINASSDPLYVIDGYPAGNNININPNDIESIDVLKDAASAAIYGSRGAGGVILITTKRGKEGTSHVDYDVQAGFGQLSKKVDLLNASQFIDLFIDGRNNAYKDLVVNSGKPWSDNMFMDDNATRVKLVGNAGSVQLPTDIYDFSTGRAKAPQYETDWQDELYRNAPFQRHNLSFYGGSEKVHYYISGSYQNQDGIMLGTDQTLFNFRSNIDAQISKRLQVGANIAFTYNDNNEVGTGRYNGSPSMAALLYLPYLPARDQSGNPIQYQMAELSAQNYGIQNPENPLAYVSMVKDNRKERRSLYNAFANFDIIEGLRLRVNGGVTTYNEKYDYYKPTSLSDGNYAPYSPQAINAAYAQADNQGDLDILGEATLNYKKSFGDHNLDALIGYSAQQTDVDFTSVRANGFQSDAIGEITDKGAAPTNFWLEKAYKQRTTLESYFSRVSYNYKSKYFLQATFRADGSSRFGPNNKWGYFPSVSGGWTLSNEDFYNDWLGSGSSVKVRASWGLSGNNNIGDYEALPTYNAPGGTIIGGQVATAYWPDDLKDPNLSWESTSQYNAGLDVGILNGRVNFLANFYLSRSYNLLFNQPISAVSGTSSILTNLEDSKVQNKGFDFQVDAALIQKQDFNLSFSGNINVNRNKVLDLGGASTIYMNGAERSYITHVTQEGQPVGMFWGFKVLGVATEENYQQVAPSAAQSNPMHPGDLYFEDINGDGIVNDSDKQIIGNPYPDFTYGFAISARYKKFDLRASFNGSQGNKILDGYDYYLYNMEGSGNQYADVDQRWRSAASPGNGKVYRASRAGTQSNSTRLSDFYLQDGSYLRMTNIMVGFTFPEKWISSLKISGARFFASVDNPFTITDYKGYNPEPDYNNGKNATNLTPGVDYGLYPLVRSYNLGLKVTF
ncbi:MAG TPA: TonB-dependent receptor [Pseudosphingobacterium sp.]|nr:TonB-dependent receptor [Pseudosphingobacterium sp.]